MLIRIAGNLLRLGGFGIQASPKLSTPCRLLGLEHVNDRSCCFIFPLLPALRSHIKRKLARVDTSGGSAQDMTEPYVSDLLGFCEKFSSRSRTTLEWKEMMEKRSTESQTASGVRDTMVRGDLIQTLFAYKFLFVSVYICENFRHASLYNTWRSSNKRAYSHGLPGVAWGIHDLNRFVRMCLLTCSTLCIFHLLHGVS